MPKPMSMTIEVEEMAFGKIFRTLDGMPGVVSINLKGAGPKAATPKGKANGDGTANGGKTLNTLLLEAMLASKNVLTAADLASALQAHGKSRNSAQGTLSRLKAHKLVKRSGKGWKITPAGIKAATTKLS